MRRIGVTGLAAGAASFVMAFLGSPIARAADVWLYKVTKGIHYEQAVSTAPTVLVENGYVFQANVFLTAAGTASGATIVSQEGTVRTLAFDDDDELEFRNRVNTKNTLETRYPDGNFRFTINTVHDGTRIITLPLLGNTYPNAPRIQNLSALQSQNANGYIVVTWDPLIGGTAGDYIQLRIEDSSGDLVWETPDLGEAGALDGTSTFALIEAGDLRPSMAYRATLMFDKSCGRDTTSYPGAIGWSTYHARTEFTMGTSVAVAPSVETYEIAKGRGFEQTNAAPPGLDPGDEFMFRAEVRGTAPNLISSATLTIPTGSVNLVGDSDLEDFDFSESMATQGALDAKYPAGTYTFRIQTTSQGLRTPALSLSASGYPPAPRLHFDPSQEVRADRELRLVWDAWPGGTANDFVQLRVEDNDGDNIFETPDFDDKDALDGRATSATIPAGTLVPGKSYDARLTFHRCVAIDSSSYPGALGQAIYFSRTKFEIETVPPDVKDYEVTKSRVYVQSSAGAPVATGFVFTATLEAETSSSINTAAIVTPTGRTVFLVQQSDGETLRVRDVRTSQAALDADYPDGNYILAINGANDGGRNVPVALTGGAYPNAPRLNNFDAGGRINHEADFQLRWDAFIGGLSRDFIDVEIEEMDGDEVFETEGYGDNDALDGLDTNVTVPANTLELGRVYMCRLNFEKVLRADDAGYPGVDGRVGYAAQTFVKVATAGPGNPPLLASYAVMPDRRVQFSVATLDGGTYEIQGSANMRDWTTLGTVSATDDRTPFTAPPPPVGPCYFYRARWMR
jgi:hypothetical protein